MKLKDRANSFQALAYKLGSLSADEKEELSLGAINNNPWFTKKNTLSAVDGILQLLESSNFEAWINSYEIKSQDKKVGLIMAGNIPFVGFHDLLSVVISGNIAMVKLSSKDDYLMRYLINLLTELSPAIAGYVQIVDRLKNIDAVIATGSDNSSRYFDYYFSKFPNIIRKNRSSVAILTGAESNEDYEQLGIDVFQYFGLGCRNVSKLFIHENFDLTKLLASLESYSDILDHHKYSNNYDYHKSIFLVNREDHLDNGFILLKESEQMVSPISVLFYERYYNDAHLEQLLTENSLKIQCVVGNHPKATIPFGKAQKPTVFDYADNVDTMDFLTNL